MTTGEPDLIHQIAAIEHVEDVEFHWSPALEVRVRLDAMDWDARHAVTDALGLYMDEPGREWLTAISVVFTIPEPVDFTRVTLKALRAPV